jgi:phage gp36-like protein
MFLTTSELQTHLYGEQIEAISGNDETLLNAAVDGAIAEARGYLSAFDRDAIFNASGSNRNALLLIFVKDIAVWHYINLCNPGTDLKLRQDRYDRAISWLKEVQKGNVSPDLPVVMGDDGVVTGAQIIFGSNPQREQHF